MTAHETHRIPGTPQGTIRIPLMKSTYFREEETREALIAFLRSTNRLSMGEQCGAFEKAFASKQKRKYAVMVGNGSQANLVLIQALLNTGRLKREDRVGISSLTWPTNVMPILQLGMLPVAIDCETTSMNVSSRQLEPHLDGIRAFFATNVLGFCADMDRIRALCRERDVLLIEDNCESLGSVHAGTLLGNFGLASTFSFFVGHHLSTIEGGMICTDDEELWHMLIMIRAHGWDRNLPPAAQEAVRKRHGIDPFCAKYAFYELAYNARPTEISGFLGMHQLPMLEETLVQRERNFKRFHAATKEREDAYHTMDVTHMDRVANFAMPIVCREAKLYERLLQAFVDAGVEIRPIIAGDMTQHPFYRKYVPTPEPCPTASFIHAQGLYFPNHPELTDEEVEMMCNLLRQAR
ncbi:MAG: hypothetical protein G01um101425_42 [Candidatus Peregrinibacteria bacterium Gr01-1014_25]|nr:MAG: hypothetical protein G01um101425_42 [Candidatus Peregrinibacteria bacterium Gr01-1014_25]